MWTLMCKNQHLFFHFFFCNKKQTLDPHPPMQTMWPSAECVTRASMQNIPFAEFVKVLLSNVYINITKEPACQSPADG